MSAFEVEAIPESPGVALGYSTDPGEGFPPDSLSLVSNVPTYCPTCGGWHPLGDACKALSRTTIVPEAERGLFSPGTLRSRSDALGSSDLLSVGEGIHNKCLTASVDRRSVRIGETGRKYQNLGKFATTTVEPGSVDFLNVRTPAAMVSPDALGLSFGCDSHFHGDVRLDAVSVVTTAPPYDGPGAVTNEGFRFPQPSTGLAHDRGVPMDSAWVTPTSLDYGVSEQVVSEDLRFPGPSTRYAHDLGNGMVTARSLREYPLNLNESLTSLESTVAELTNFRAKVNGRLTSLELRVESVVARLDVHHEQIGDLQEFREALQELSSVERQGVRKFLYSVGASAMWDLMKMGTAMGAAGAAGAVGSVLNSV